MQVVLITGASSGIGAATARELQSHGFDVFGTTRRPEALPADAAPVRWLAMDVRDDASVQAGVESVLKQAGRLDALVCNAGNGIFGSIEEVSIAQAQAQLDTNFFGTLRTLRAALPHLRASGAGRVVLVGSLAGRAPIPFQAHYSASKAAVESLAFALHCELNGTGVQVALVEPGDIHTAFNDQVDFSASEGSVYGERIARCRETIETSLLHAPPPEWVARAIRKALSDPRPRVRYAVGREAWLVAFARRVLPDRLSLALLRRHFGV